VGKVAMILGDEQNVAIFTEARTWVDSAFRKCCGLWSTMACVASSRSPSTWYSWIQCRAFSMKKRRTGSLCLPSRFTAPPQGV
jgi:hypothetical protein